MSLSPINQWRGEYWFLDNSYETPITVDGITYPSVSHAFMGAQAGTLLLKLEISKSSLDSLERLAEQIDQLPSDFRGPDTMRKLLEEKFGYSDKVSLMGEHQAKLAMNLISTGRQPLIYGNDVCNTFWGSCTCHKHKDIPGKNVVGGLIMAVRRRLIDQLTRDVAMDQTCACEKPNQAFFLYSLNGKLWLKPFCNACQTQCGMFLAKSSLPSVVHRFEKDWFDQKDKGVATQPKRQRKLNLRAINQQIVKAVGNTVHPFYRGQYTDDLEDDSYVAEWEAVMWGGHLPTKPPEKEMAQNVVLYLSGRIS